MLRAVPAGSRPSGETTGTTPRLMAARTTSESSTVVTSPDEPRSVRWPFAPACEGTFRARMTPRPDMPCALPPNSLILPTIIGLMAFSSVSATMAIDAASVTRKPLTNCALIPASRIRVVMALPAAVDDHRVDADRFQKDHVVQGALDEVLVLHRAAAVLDDERLVAELLDERQRIQEDFRLEGFRFVAHLACGRGAALARPGTGREWR